MAKLSNKVMNDLSEIKIIRKKLDLTQKDLAKVSGVSQSLIAKIESGKIDPSYTNAIKIFETLRHIEKKNQIICREIMNRKIISVRPQDTVVEAIKKMRKFEISQMPVIIGNEVKGYVSDSILLEKILKEKSEKLLIEDVMEDTPPALPEDATKEVVISLLKFFPLVIIVKKGKPIGIITKADLLRTIYK